MKFIKKIIAYGIAIIIVVVLEEVIREQFEANDRVAVLLIGTIFAIAGLWLMFRPKSAMQRYRKSQKTAEKWHRRLPNLTDALEDVGNVDKELSDAVYSSKTGTRILGFLSFLFGIAAVLAALFLA